MVEAKGIGKAFAGRPVVADFSHRLLRGDRLGVVGPNGSGKTTLVGLLTGALTPDSGQVRLGANVEMASLDQGRESLDPSWTLGEALTGGRGDTVTIGGQKRHVVGYMKDFLFEPQQARTPLGVLSGGERGRLMLARALAKPSNLLVLDEPTNDLDLETLDVLEEMLADLRRHRHPDQPRPRLPRSHRQRRAGAGGRGPLGRVCRRLLRHAGPARRRPRGHQALRRSPSRNAMPQPRNPQALRGRPSAA